LGDSIGGWIGDEFDSIRDWISENTPEFVKKLAEGDVLGAVRSIFGGSGGGNSSPTRTPSPIPQTDLEWYGDYFGSQPYGGRSDPKTGTPGFEPAGMTIPARLDLDTTDALAKMNALGFGAGSKKTIDSRFKAVFDLDTDKASSKNTEALLWGTTWAGSIYESAFTINDADAVTKKDAAFLSGMNWAGSVFTAKFSVDISPLETALTRTREIAQEISDLLPRSPARKGPLARPISFGYIGDAMKSAMRGMARDAELGMSALTGTLAGPTPTAGRARSGGGTTINIITIPPDEWLELARAVERGESIDLNLARELAVRKARAVS
jgi:hypothetical protein